MIFAYLAYPPEISVLRTHDCFLSGRVLAIVIAAPKQSPEDVALSTFSGVC